MTPKQSQKHDEIKCNKIYRRISDVVLDTVSDIHITCVSRKN